MTDAPPPLVTPEQFLASMGALVVELRKNRETTKKLTEELHAFRADLKEALGSGKAAGILGTLLRGGLASLRGGG